MPTFRVALICVSLVLLSGCDLFQVGPRDIDGDGWAEDLDCDDLDPAIYPEAGESCDGVDNDCDGAIDEGYDADGDGWAPCSDPPDCNDEDPTIFPGAEEFCDGIDSNCNGDDDEDTGCDPSEDADGDGYTADEDCDDSDPWSYPGAGELCDGSDNDCDGEVDEDFFERETICGVGSCAARGVNRCGCERVHVHGRDEDATDRAKRCRERVQVLPLYNRRGAYSRCEYGSACEDTA